MHTTWVTRRSGGGSGCPCPTHLPLGVDLCYLVVRGIECPEAGKGEVGQVQDLQEVVAEVETSEGVQEEERGVKRVREGVVAEVE